MVDVEARKGSFGWNAS